MAPLSTQECLLWRAFYEKNHGMIWDNIAIEDGP